MMGQEGGTHNLIPQTFLLYMFPSGGKHHTLRRLMSKIQRKELRQKYMKLFSKIINNNNTHQEEQLQERQH